ncbi:MAG: hypothetical protein HY903_08435 [Deltaproteobacteria bacterium]|nr:hypothetical protein [Deltaproteobacteria bacterium]
MCNQVQNTSCKPTTATTSCCGQTGVPGMPQGVQSLDVSASVCGDSVKAMASGTVTRDRWVTLSPPRVDFCKQRVYISVMTEPAKGHQSNCGPAVVDFGREMFLPLNPRQAHGRWTIYLTDSCKPGNVLAETTLDFQPACHSHCGQ